jgi:hypothetical protein
MAAYPSVSAPYGLQPINLIGGQPFAGQTRELPITTSSVNYNTAIFNGDVVALTTSGTIIKSALAADASPLAGTVGVFVGVSYTNPATSQKLFAQYWPGFASGVTDAVAYIVDDPDALFKVVSVGSTADSTGLTPVALAQTVLGNNVALVQNTGSTVTDNSKVGVYWNSGATTSSLPFRIVELVPDTATAAGFYEVIVKFNFGYHSYYNATGV